MKKIKNIVMSVLAVLVVLLVGPLQSRLSVGEPNVEPTFSLESSTAVENVEEQEEKPPQGSLGNELEVREDGEYDTKDEVALYLWTYQRLPANYMTKSQARKQGWENGPLYKVVPGKCIGGDVYGNYEGVLPKIKGKYRECDIDTLGRKSRGSKRIVYDENFNIYYTEDHYESFEQLYGG